MCVLTLLLLVCIFFTRLELLGWQDCSFTLVLSWQLAGFVHCCRISKWVTVEQMTDMSPFSSCLQSCPASGSFPVSQLFPSGGQSIGASASALVLPVNNIQGWFPLRLNGYISLQSEGLSRVFSSTTVWRDQFFGAQPSFWFNSHIHTWLLEKP